MLTPVAYFCHVFSAAERAQHYAVVRSPRVVHKGALNAVGQEWQLFYGAFIIIIITVASIAVGRY